MFAHKEQKQILITLKSVCSADISYWFKWHIIAFTPVVGSVFQKHQVVYKETSVDCCSLTLFLVLSSPSHFPSMMNHYCIRVVVSTTVTPSWPAIGCGRLSHRSTGSNFRKAFKKILVCDRTEIFSEVVVFNY